MEVIANRKLSLRAPVELRHDRDAHAEATVVSTLDPPCVRGLPTGQHPGRRHLPTGRM